ncbi:hypothetical protein IMG5_070760 [Ichthyophthirius multifiliis]|uniref:Uncharacterized protein n=1 Tax=Ichthyophthirius multifiliis TaxID=5932 RepID=G0QPS9_ICHMU|nr:hypothetical protein IMG5_070760 [Ichthyophthirius multifiliis]EGR32794.1 hypothetical protein IMG5_070760 [Ichthyophthirius multifiliis]|eukprot:XP_004036780.1 hypothetical protein IMG5_070760 [Ichthyophthirius multifiliis]
MKDTFPFLAFLTFSTFIIYKMELQLDKMNRTVFKVKTLKEQEIEKENDYIRKALKGDKITAENIQITDVPDKRNKYKFEELEEEGDFDTRDDFLEGLRNEYNQGVEIQEEYKDQVINYSKRENKILDFGIDKNKEI